MGETTTLYCYRTVYGTSLISYVTGIVSPMFPCLNRTMNTIPLLPFLLFRAMTKQKRGSLVPTPTKGKGGGKGGGGGKTETVLLKDCPLQLKEFPVDNSAPKYVLIPDTSSTLLTGSGLFCSIRILHVGTYMYRTVKINCFRKYNKPRRPVQQFFTKLIEGPSVRTKEC